LNADIAWINQIQGFTGLFFSDFEDTADDEQWGTLPASWDDDYTTSPAPLFGSESLYAAANGTHSSDTFSTDSSGTVYIRTAFRLTGNGISSGSAIQFGLRNNSTEVARLALFWNSGTNKFYRIYAYDSSTSNYTEPTENAFGDATYWLYLTYTRSTSVVAQIKDASHNLVSGWTVTLSTSDSNSLNNVFIIRELAGISFIMDNVEVRKDTNWGI
jgi:hypothetical protein